MTSGESARFLEAQRDFFEDADPAHFQWQTSNPYVSRTERELLKGFPIASRTRFLEVGCGEGANIANLLFDGPPDVQAVGIDLFERKVAFAARQGIPARFVCGDALRLPFGGASFDLVLCRDVLHHLADREGALRELRRVAKLGATVWVVEPNGRNPLMSLLALLRPHERGLRSNSGRTLSDLVAPYFRETRLEYRQPMPIYRLVLHYQVGLPRLASSGIFRLVLDGWEALVRFLIPRSVWAYLVIRAEA